MDQGAAAAQSLVSNIGLLVGEEFQKLRGVGGEVTNLRDVVATVNALLRMQSEADPAAVDHFLREWMKQLREAGYDAEDCIDLYLLRIKCRPDDGFLAWSMHLIPTLLARHRLAGDIKALRARVAAINEQHTRYGVSIEPLRRQPSLLPQAAVAASAHALSPANDPNQFVGMTGQAKTLAAKVKAAAAAVAADMGLPVFSIVGFGGLGKTTLAMEVCRQLEADFPRQAQVSVSQAFDATKDLKRLLKGVLRQVSKPAIAEAGGQGIKEEDNVGAIDSMDEDELAEKLEETLNNNKRYLIVIDDVWTVAAWASIKSKLPDKNCGCRIIVTTRIDTVAKACSSGSDCIHHIEALSEEDSESLFLSRTFGPLGSCPPDLKGVMKNILKKCGGLPLAIVSIASILKGYTSPQSKHMWNRILKSFGSQIESHPTLEGMKQIVLLSFDHLPHHLKACMMYLSIFPEDYEIPKERLLRRWIAEGLVAERRGLTSMEVAEDYLNELVSRSMIDRAADIVSYYDGREETCRVHDMTLEVMVNKSLEANFVSLIGGQYEGMSYDCRVRRLSIHGGVEPSKQSSSKKTAAGRSRRSRINGMNVQHARSLSVFGLEGHKLLNYLGEFTLMRVLDLEDCEGIGKKHMAYICRMYLLKFLSLKGTDITEIPKKIANLKHLQTLDVRFTCLEDLPNSVTELEELESLQFSSKKNINLRWMPPPGLKRMKALCKANKVVVRSNKQVAEEIGELKHLQELGIYIDSSEYVSDNNVSDQDVSDQDSEDVSDQDVSDQDSEDVSDPDVSDQDKEDVSNQDVSDQDSEDVSDQDDVLSNLRDSLGQLTSLRCLNIGDMHGICGGLAGYGLPDWVGQLTNLVDFVIAWAYLEEGDPLFEVLCKLPNLRRLTLEAYFYGGNKLVACRDQSLQELTELDLRRPQSESLKFEFEEQSMPKLEKLYITFYDHDITIVGIEHLTSLKEVQMSSLKSNEKPMKHALEVIDEENRRRTCVGSNPLEVKVQYD
ncbi:hypothetical protein U9M48_040977 [Paspalum notatum var. saurae]|uniref:Uncharacterized protein n=1 Tax=Paspalum notatum var. saurae TaxID=547442 RepID=A0AAQ3URL7_PASNO